MKYGFLTICGLIGSFISNLYGGWTESLTTLCIFMLVDFVTGLYIAWRKKSSKTDSGGLSSKVCWDGLAKKCMTMLLVLIVVRLELASGTTFLKDGVCIAFITNETISILENAKLLGIKIPPLLNDALDILSNKKEV